MDGWIKIHANIKSNKGMEVRTSNPIPRLSNEKIRIYEIVFRYYFYIHYYIAKFEFIHGYCL